MTGVNPLMKKQRRTAVEYLNSITGFRYGKINRFEILYGSSPSRELLSLSKQPHLVLSTEWDR